MMTDSIRKTRSVCPVCLAPVSARVIRREGGLYMEKSCGAHGDFSVIVWRDKVDIEEWRGDIPQVLEGENEKCPHGCAGCGSHMQGSCCVLLEVTGKCNLNCSFCFAGEYEDEPSHNRLKRSIDSIMSADDKPLLQFSGGEPTLRDDLPELISYAREKGCKYTQLNTNGIRLAEDERYAEALERAGLSFVFMQFDGIGEQVYEALRGAPVYEKKLRAIEMCGKYNIGVTLVPTIVRGLNDRQIGGIIKLGASLTPSVRGIHFQPVSYFGRYPSAPSDESRFTLDELISAIAEQAGVGVESLRPSRCDHPLCGFHGSFISEGGNIRPLTRSRPSKSEASIMTTARQNREYVGQRWKREPEEEMSCCQSNATESLDSFLSTVKKHGFTITAMAFQDAMNMDIERLRRCSLHVYDNGVLRPFCAKYITSVCR